MISNLAKQLTPSPTITLDAKVKNMQSRGIKVINLGVGEPDFDTPVHIQRSAIKAMQAGFTHYTSISGNVKLKSIIADKFYKDNGIRYDQSQIIVGLGSKPLLYLAFLSLINKGDEVLIPRPSWNTFTEQVRICKGTPVFIDLKAPFKLKAEDVEKRITKKTKVLLLNSPSNPTGMIIERIELEKIAQLALKYNFFIISDEIYEKMVYTGKHVSIASLNKAIKEKVITINGFSKAYAMTGWRIGYAGGPKEIISAMVSLQGQIGSSAVTFVQIAAEEALKGSRKPLKIMFSELNKRRKYVLSELGKIYNISVVDPDGAFYIFVSIEKLLGKKYKTSTDWCEALLEKQNVAVVPGEAFFYPGYFRLSYASSMENLRDATKRINKFISS